MATNTNYKKNRGLLINVEGINGVGKTTLIKKLLKTFPYSTSIKFPTGKNNRYNKFIKKYMVSYPGPKYNSTVYYPKPSQKLASSFRMDRVLTLPKVLERTETHNFIFLDRYIFSNIAYQIASLKCFVSSFGAEMLIEDIKTHMEVAKKIDYSWMTCPLPDLVIIMTNTADNILSNIKKSQKPMIRFTKNVNFLMEVQKEYLKMVDLYNEIARFKFFVIDCSKHEDNVIFKKVKSKINEIHTSNIRNINYLKSPNNILRREINKHLLTSEDT